MTNVMQYVLSIFWKYAIVLIGLRLAYWFAKEGLDALVNSIRMGQKQPIVSAEMDRWSREHTDTLDVGPEYL